MSKKLLREFFELKCDERGCQDLLTESEKKMVSENDFCIFPAKLQEAGAVNGNNRVYTEEVLRREIDNYQKLVQENRALGECVDDQTQIFTSSGWRYLKDVQEQDMVFTYNTETSEIEEQEVEAVINKEYSGEMIHFQSNSDLDMKLTLNHKMLLFDRDNQPYYCSVEELYEKHISGKHISKESIRKSGTWKGETPKDFTFPGTDKKVNPLDWMAFLGIYLAEGFTDGTKRGYKKSNRVVITQKKQPIVEKIRRLFARLEIDANEQTRSNGTIDFYIQGNKELHTMLFALGNSHNKYIPEEFKSWGPESLIVLLDWMLLGDGKNRTSRGKLLREYCTTSPKLAEDVEELMLKTGLGCTVSVRQPYDRKIEGRVILKENQKPLYIIHESTAKDKYLDTRFVILEKVEYEGRVYCVKTENGNWMARRNGQMFWTGNCDHPDDSVINLKNASHMVNRIWWDGNNVLGTIKVLKTPSGNILRGLYESGVLFGFSSRAMGSLKEGKDDDGNPVQVVQEDLQLICFDAVSEPSAPGAYLMRENTEKNLQQIYTKGDRINRALNEILRG